MHRRRRKTVGLRSSAKFAFGLAAALSLSMFIDKSPVHAGSLCPRGVTEAAVSLYAEWGPSWRCGTSVLPV